MESVHKRITHAFHVLIIQKKTTKKHRIVRIIYIPFSNERACAPLDRTLASAFSSKFTNDVQTGPTPTLERIESGRFLMKNPRTIAIEPLVSDHSFSF